MYPLKHRTTWYYRNDVTFVYETFVDKYPLYIPSPNRIKRQQKQYQVFDCNTLARYFIKKF